MQIETEFSDSAKKKVFSQLQLQLESCENGPKLGCSFFLFDR